MDSFKGIIALDIDGTITVDKHSLENEVLNFLTDLMLKGWKIIFITGRTFSFAMPILADLKTPYYLSVQNGASLYAMPNVDLLKRFYLDTKILPEVTEIFSEEPAGLLVESGKDQEDFCFYKPSDFISQELEYVHFRISISPEKWVPLTCFEQLPIKEFAVGKYFATEPKAYEIAERLNRIGKQKFNIIVIRDPFRLGHHLAHINHEDASKGKILRTFLEMQPKQIPVIGAGDDMNDLEMLEQCNFKIAMSDAPEILKDQADLIAPSAKEMGIISGLEKAIASL